MTYWETFNSAVVCAYAIFQHLDILHTLLVFLIYSHFFCSHHKQLNGDLKHITLVMLAVNVQVALISSSYSETRLPLYIHEQFAMSLHLLCSTMLHLWLYYMQTTVLFKLKVKDIQYVIFQHLDVLHTLHMFHIYIYIYIYIYALKILTRKS